MKRPPRGGRLGLAPPTRGLSVASGPLRLAVRLALGRLHVDDKVELAGRIGHEVGQVGVCHKDLLLTGLSHLALH